MEEGKKKILKFVTALLACSLLLLVLIPAVSALPDLRPEPAGSPFPPPPSYMHVFHYPESDWLTVTIPPDVSVCKGKPYFDLTNYVRAGVRNGGTDDASSFKVGLYVDDTLIGENTISGLDAGEAIFIGFEWTPAPTGEDPLTWTDTAQGAICTYTDTSETYELKIAVDEDNEVAESDETNNEITEEQKVVWNGYMADEPLENYVHGEVEGGIIYTTGDGYYLGRFTDGTEYDTYHDVNYDLEIPGSVKLARLYIYHTWSKPEYKAPEIGVTLKTPSDDVHELNMEKSYNDIKGDFGAWRYVWGTYAYNITEHVKERGTYVVTVTNLNSGSDDDFATEYALAAPAILVIYEDTRMQKREYWINEGADVLMGGRRDGGGFLALKECKNTAAFDEWHMDLEVEKATLGVVSAWGDNALDDVLYFNVGELEEGVYCGYNDPCSEEMEGISMNIGGSCAQVGMAAFDVTYELEDYDNEVIQGDDGDNMMPVNAFLVITYEREPTANRTLPAEPVSAGESITIVIEAAQHGYFAQIIETLPEGSVYVDSTLERESVEVGDNTVKFELGDKHSFNYTVKVKAPESEGTYAFSGILIVEGNEYEVDGDKEIEVTPGPPKITAWNPIDAVVNNTEGESRTFNISVNQIVDISWQINGAEVQTNESITEAAYTNTSSVVGIWNVSVIATNTTTGLSVLHTWIWNVTLTPTATPTSTVNVSPTPTPATEEKQKTGAEEAPVPGFGLAISLFILIGVAYLIRVRKQGGVE